MIITKINSFYIFTSIILTIILLIIIIYLKKIHPVIYILTFNLFLITNLIFIYIYLNINLFIYIIFISLTGGIIIIFLYFTRLIAKTKFKLYNLNKFIYTFISIISIWWLINITKFSLTIESTKINFDFKIFYTPYLTLTTTSIIYIFLILLISINIATIKNIPLRIIKYYENIP